MRIERPKRQSSLIMNHLLADDHSELDSLLEELFAALDGDDVELIYQKLDLFWARLAMHIRAEHLHLFPAILGAIEARAAENKSLPTLTTAQSTIEKLHNDHNFFMRELIATIKKMRVLRENKTAAYLSKQISDVRETIVSVSNRLKTHNELEETEVYLWADKLLDSADRFSLNELMKKEIENLPPRFGDKTNL